MCIMGFVQVVNRIQLNIKLLGNPGGRRESGASEEVRVGVGGEGGGEGGEVIKCAHPPGLCGLL